MEVVIAGNYKKVIKFKMEGNKTICTIIEPPFPDVIGIARCHPYDDFWDAGIGRRVALAKAMKGRYSRLIRKLVWETYYKTYPDKIEMQKKRKQGLLAQKTLKPKKKRLGYFRRLLRAIFSR